MIDLSKNINKKLWSIKLEDGTVLKVKPPTQSMLAALVEMSQVEDKEDLEILNELYELITQIFNRNINKLEFDKLEIEEMIGVDTASLILEDYLNSTIAQLGK